MDVVDGGVGATEEVVGSGWEEDVGVDVGFLLAA